ncbi:hypothetical protein F5878DRAFT_729722, partial [Lentinula raphanica]
MGASRFGDHCMANVEFVSSIRALVMYDVLIKERDSLHKLPSHLPHLKHVLLKNNAAKNEPLLSLPSKCTSTSKPSSFLALKASHLWLVNGTGGPGVAGFRVG